VSRDHDIARRLSTAVWLSACDDSEPGNRPGAHVLCDVCDGGAGPTHTALAVERSAAFVVELDRRGIGEGVAIPADLIAMNDAPAGFDGWPDALEIEHEAWCPVGRMLELAALAEIVRIAGTCALAERRVQEQASTSDGPSHGDDGP